jgi:hypothetical protein
MCNMHSDVKNDCFQIPHHPHDVALYDSMYSFRFSLYLRFCNDPNVLPIVLAIALTTP